MGADKLVEVVILAVLGVALWNVVLNAQNTPSVVNAVGSQSNDILKTLTAH